MTDDVKVLRECGNDWIDVSRQMRPQDTVGLGAKALFVLGTIARRTADAIEREEAKENSDNGELLIAPEWNTGNEPEYSRADLHHLDAIISGGAENAAKRPALVDLMTGVRIALSEAEDRGWNAAIEAAAKVVDSLATGVVEAAIEPADGAAETIRSLRRGAS